MSARKKLNAAHGLGSLIVASLVGACADSVAVFLVTLVALLLADWAAGNIRPPKR